MKTADTMGVWQSIETAPRDGTRILAWDGNIVIIIRVHDFWRRWTDDFGDDLLAEPTRWCPLPPPPGEAMS